MLECLVNKLLLNDLRELTVALTTLRFHVSAPKESKAEMNERRTSEVTLIPDII